MAGPAKNPLTTNPRHVVVAYLVLVFALSSCFWYIFAARPQFIVDTGIFRLGFLPLMWCPAVAAIGTRLYFQRNLDGFGFSTGELRWWFLAMALPVVTGFVMYGAAWITGTAPFLLDKGMAMLAMPALFAILAAICTNIVSATGEELGWRGLLVPELGRFATFTLVALVSGIIWFFWHVPLMLMGLYGDGSAYSIVAFFLSLVGGSVIFAWIRLRSGSIWPAAILHGFWNYFIQTFYPALTEMTAAGEAMVGEFGWFCVVISVLLGLLFWHLRYMLPKMPKPEGGL